MFNMLICCKQTVSIRCGKDDIKGVISNYYPAFQLIKVNNVLIPIELIEHIEVLDGTGTSPSYTPQRAVKNSSKLRLVPGGHTR
ncbi:hypothetical protein [Paenibacillus aestuarii]|uniref:Uncharacterized protein n=1 Tax=Paenibacillus aestuarii TaxID=516965 RepID=A0ABW0K9B2_9BACL|nr:hypothetical protein [Paenibacillus aestuarii]